jgi:hypothetical protein
MRVDVLLVQVVESLAAEVSQYAAEVARADAADERTAPQALHVSAVMIHKDFEYTLVKPTDLTHLTKEINVCSILQQQTVNPVRGLAVAACLCPMCAAGNHAV